MPSRNDWIDGLLASKKHESFCRAIKDNNDLSTNCVYMYMHFYVYVGLPGGHRMLWVIQSLSITTHFPEKVNLLRKPALEPF